MATVYVLKPQKDYIKNLQKKMAKESQDPTKVTEADAVAELISAYIRNPN
jgi:hypothetical protein